jgi:hypothetical protein
MTQDSNEAYVARNVELAVACGAPPAMLVAVALATAAPDTIAEALVSIARWSQSLAQAAAAPRSSLKTLAEIEPELSIEPELARVRPDLSDHELRGELVFRDLTGKRSFFQVAAWAIGGVELSLEDSDYLEDLGVVTQLQDVRIWPLAITRRAGMGRGGFAHALIAGLAAMLNPNMAVQPVGAFMRFLDRLEARIEAGSNLEAELEAVVARREKVPGVGRPALGPDERNRHVVDIVHRFGKDRGKSWALALLVDEFFERTKGQHINSAGLQGAILRDLGFSPTSATALCVLYFVVPVLAHAVFAAEARERSGRNCRTGIGTAA